MSVREDPGFFRLRAAFVIAGLVCVSAWIGTSDGPNWSLTLTTRLVYIALWLLPLVTYFVYVRSRVGALVLGSGVLVLAVGWLFAIFREEGSTVGLGFFYGPFSTFFLVGIGLMIETRALRR